MPDLLSDWNHAARSCSGGASGDEDGRRSLECEWSTTTFRADPKPVYLRWGGSETGSVLVIAWIASREISGPSEADRARTEDSVNTPHVVMPTTARRYHTHRSSVQSANPLTRPPSMHSRLQDFFCAWHQLRLTVRAWVGIAWMLKDVERILCQICQKPESGPGSAHIVRRTSAMIAAVSLLVTLPSRVLPKDICTVTVPIEQF